MFVPYLKLNGFDILPFVESQGVKWTIYDLDSPDAGRTLDGIMHRGRVATKVKVEIKCIPVKPTDALNILTQLNNEYISMETDIDPMFGTSFMTMYNSSRPCTVLHIDEDGEPTWGELAFSLMEQ